MNRNIPTRREMTPEVRRKVTEGPERYQITVRGALDPDWSDWFNGFEIYTTMDASGTCITIMTGVITDQVALRGVVNKIWDLNLELVALYKSSDPSGPKSPDESSL